MELPPVTRGTLRRIKRTHGLPFTTSVQRGVALLEKSLEPAAA